MAADTENMEEPMVVESLLLSVAHHWSRRETLARQFELLERHFSQDQMLSALWKLHELSLIAKPSKRSGGAAKSATRGQAEDVANAIGFLGDNNKLPRFVVQSEDLPRVLPLLGALSVGDERSVAARLEALEGSQRQNMMEMRRMMANSGSALSSMNANPASQMLNPGIIVSPPSFGSPSGVDGGVAAHQLQSKPSYASRASRGAGAGGGRAEGQIPPQQDFLHRPTRADQNGRAANARGRVERSSSSKRRRLSQEEDSTEPWRSQGRPRKVKARPKVNTGSANMVGLEDLAGPAEFWVGNTRADTSEDKVGEVLKQAADNIKITDFKVEEVICLTKEALPRTRSWKVTVPARLRDHMLNPEMYPAGWTFRAFTTWQKRPAEEGAKKASVAPATGGAEAPKV